MKKFVLGSALIVLPLIVFSQGLNSHWLIGSANLLTDPKARIYFNNSSYTLSPGFRKMVFKGTQATISDEQGNFLMSSNGVWIANANNDTMMNGAGLNPGSYVGAWSNGLPIINGNVFVDYPGDSNKIVLIHQTGDPTLNGLSTEFFYSEIDRTLDAGLGAVTSKNNVIFNDTLAWGIAACKHANGRDWWIEMSKDSSDLFYKVLFSNNGNPTVSTQNLSFTPLPHETVVQHTFSQDGSKFITSTYDNPIDRNNSLILADFDRCTGIFSNVQSIPIVSGTYIWGLAFSPSGEYIYACSSINLFQINTTTLVIDTVATYDGFISGFPPSCCATTFLHMYLAANGKIYITSGSSVQHIHEMNYPDSAGLACDVQQHAINLGVWNLRAVPNHPNYYLGPVIGSSCDTLGLGISENEYNFKFSVSPNPNNGQFKISYLLPQNEKGKFEIFDVNGQRVYEINLPQWSTMQYVTLPEWVSAEVYSMTISSNFNKANRKIILIKD